MTAKSEESVERRVSRGWDTDDQFRTKSRPRETYIFELTRDLCVSEQHAIELSSILICLNAVLESIRSFDRRSES